MTVVAEAIAPPTSRALLARPDWRAVALAGAGMLLTFAAPQHRMDLLLIGVLASLTGIVWSPYSGAVLIGATLPTFFFTRTLLGPLSVTPPGLALMLTWLAIFARRRQLPLRF